MRVSTSFLREALDRILTHLESKGLGEIPLDYDYYWDIPVEQVYNPLADPSGLSLGQLTDDLEILEKVNRGDLPPLRANLRQLGALLSALGSRDEP